MRLTRVKWVQCWSSHPFSSLCLYEKILKNLCREFSGGEDYVILLVSTLACSRLYRLRLKRFWRSLMSPSFLGVVSFRLLLSVSTAFQGVLVIFVVNLAHWEEQTSVEELTPTYGLWESLGTFSWLLVLVEWLRQPLVVPCLGDGVKVAELDLKKSL